MTTSPMLKYGSRGWKEDYKQPLRNESEEKNIRDTNKKHWEKFSSYLQVDPAEMLKRNL